MTLSKHPEKPAGSFLFILVLISMGGALASNIILPSLSSYQLAFETDYARAQLTLTVYLAALALGQLIYGPLSDRFGRRPLVLAGLVILFLGSLICFLATSIEMIIFGRFIQATGACAGMVMGRAMVRDRYSQERAASLLAYLTMIVLVAPSLAPMLGGILEDLAGWRASFLFIQIFAALVLCISFFGAKETLPVHKRQQAHFSKLFLSFPFLLKNRVFLAFSLQVSFNTAAYFSFLGGASYVLIDLMGRTATELGFYFMMVIAFYCLGNFVAARLTQKFGISRLIKAGMLIALSGPVVMLITELTIGLTPVLFFSQMCLVAIGNGLCIVPGVSRAISADPDRVGAASGLVGSMQIGFGAIGTFVVGLLLSVFETTALPLIFVVLFCCGAAIVSSRMSARHTVTNPLENP
ncbi:MAG: multidrug effflux MFS transporter [Sneathiellales bacterium]|nr:multidrug effflux MFS transporter [Sneathiellales bacterium]